MIPKMVEQGYPKPFVIVLAASAAFLEALIPPSNAAILFSALTDVPVSKTFAAGILPGLVLMGLLSLVVIWKCRRLKVSERASSKDKLKAFWEALPGLFTPIIILGGIYSGLFTPSESAAVAGLWGIVIGLPVWPPARCQPKRAVPVDRNCWRCGWREARWRAAGSWPRRGQEAEGAVEQESTADQRQPGLK